MKFSILPVILLTAAPLASSLALPETAQAVPASIQKAIEDAPAAAIEAAKDIPPVVAQFNDWGMTERGNVPFKLTAADIDSVDATQTLRETAVAATDRLSFSTSLSNFLYYKSSRGYRAT